jgi:hypothetical protein
MPKQSNALTLSALLLLPALGMLAGGWAVVTVDALPEYFVAQQPATLSFMVRQHGVTPLKGVSPTLEARAGSRTIRGAVAPGKQDGQYVASFALPEPGEWTLTIHSGWGSSKLTLLPITTIAAGAAAPVALAAHERGRHLFVAKGCVGCHMRNEVDVGRGESIGPVLTGKRYQSEFLARFLADPATNATHTGSFRMPNLGLRQVEIASLVVFLNAERTAAR